MTSSSLPSDISLSMSVIKAKLFDFTSSSDDVSSGYNSNPLRVQLDCSSLDDDHIVYFTLPNNQEQLFGEDNITQVKQFETSCKQNKNETFEYSCPSNQLNISSKLSVYCNGTEGLITSTCPIVYTYPSCSIIGSDYSCIVNNYTTTTTTCACNICSTSNRRRLADSSVGVIEVASMTKYAFNDFADIMSSSQNIVVVDLVMSTYVMTSTFVFVWLVLFSIVMFPHIKNKYFPSEDDNEKQINSANKRRSGKVQPLTNNTSNELMLQQKFHNYISSFFNGVYGDDNSNWDKVSTELMRGHIYLAVINEKDNYMKLIQASQIFTYLSANFFLIAFLFDIRFPSDDGSCDGFISEESCLSLHSLTDASVDRCLWTASNSNIIDGICSFAIPDFSFMIIISVTIDLY
jgi:hypothetical protein